MLASRSLNNPALQYTQSERVAILEVQPQVIDQLAAKTSATPNTEAVIKLRPPFDV